MREKIKLIIRNLIFFYIICHFIGICFIIFQFKTMPFKTMPFIKSNKKPLTGLMELNETTPTNQFFVYFKKGISKNEIENFIKNYDIKIIKEPSNYTFPYLFEAKSVKDAEILSSVLLEQNPSVIDAFPRVDIQY